MKIKTPDDNKACRLSSRKRVNAIHVLFFSVLVLVELVLLYHLTPYSAMPEEQII